MGKLEATIKSEIERLAKREMRKVSVPLKREVRSLKITVSQLRKAILPLQRFALRKQKELAKQPIQLEASPEEVRVSRLSPRLVKTLRKKLGISQRDLAILTGVTLGAVASWESGKFIPKPEKKARLVALRRLGSAAVKKLLEMRTTGMKKGEK